MIRKVLLSLVAWVAFMGIAFAQVDVNKADAAALDSVKGIGPAKSKAILEERSKGEFKDWPDLERRVKGIGEKNAMRRRSMESLWLVAARAPPCLASRQPHGLRLRLPST